MGVLLTSVAQDGPSLYSYIYTKALRSVFYFILFLLLENEQVFLSSLSNYTKKNSLFGKANRLICVARGQNFHQQFSYVLDLVLCFEERRTVFSFFLFFLPGVFLQSNIGKFSNHIHYHGAHSFYC